MGRKSKKLKETSTLVKLDVDWKVKNRQQQQQQAANRKIRAQKVYYCSSSSSFLLFSNRRWCDRVDRRQKEALFSGAVVTVVDPPLK